MDIPSKRLMCLEGGEGGSETNFKSKLRGRHQNKTKGWSQGFLKDLASRGGRRNVGRED